MPEGRAGSRAWLQVLRRAAREWTADRSPQVAAALAYYTLFAIAPLLVLSVAVAGFVYGSSAGARVIAMVASVAGTRIADVLAAILAAADEPRSGVVAAVVGTITLIAGAAGAFTSAQSALDRIWGVRPRRGRGILGVLRDRLPAFVLLLAVGVLLVLSLAASAVLTGLARSVPRFGVFDTPTTQLANLALFVVVATILFSLVYVVLPDARIAFRDVWPGALLTASLFALGQLVIGTYLSVFGVGSAYGAAGSLIAVLVWLYYSAMTFLYGAELTRVMAERHGTRVEPAPHAESRRPRERTAGDAEGGARPVTQR